MFPNFARFPPLSLSLLLLLSPGLSCSGTARGADGPSVIQRGMFHVHLAQAQIPPAGKLFSGQPPVIRGLESTTQHSTDPSLCFLSISVHHHLYSLYFSLHHVFLLFYIVVSSKITRDYKDDEMFVNYSMSILAALSRIVEGFGASEGWFS